MGQFLPARAQEMAMTELFSKFDSEQFIGLVAVAGGLLCGITAIVGAFWFHIRKAEIDAALKQDMLNRGMSAEDIRTVLDAGTNRTLDVQVGKRSCRA
jgi:hypothetical protein